MMFEYIVECSMHEIQAATNGVLTESEVSSMVKDITRAFVHNLSEACKMWWNKIKGMIRNAISKIRELCRNIKNNLSHQIRSKIAANTTKWNGFIDDIKLYDVRKVIKGADIQRINQLYNSDHIMSRTYRIIPGMPTNYKLNNSNMVTFADIANGEDVKTREEFIEYAYKTAEYKGFLNAANIDNFLRAIESDEANIKLLEQEEKEYDRLVSSFIKLLNIWIEQAEYKVDVRHSNKEVNDKVKELKSTGDHIDNYHANRILKQDLNAEADRLRLIISTYFSTVISLLMKDINNRQAALVAAYKDIDSENSKKD